MLRMIIEGVGFDHLKQTVVVLKDWEGQHLLPIWIGPSEAKAIALELEGAKPSRPLSHDLLLSAIQLAQGTVARVVINDLQESTFFSTIDIDTPSGTIHIDARPSDSIAVAVRAKCPVFIDGNVKDALVEIGAVVSGDEEFPLGSIDEDESTSHPDDTEEIERFKRLLGESDE